MAYNNFLSWILHSLVTLGILESIITKTDAIKPVLNMLLPVIESKNTMYRNRLISVIKEAKSSCYKKLFEDNKSNLKLTI